MPISTNSPIRDILWNKLYQPQYQTIDQNNLGYGAERKREVDTGQAMLNERKLALEQQLAESPGGADPILMKQLADLNAAYDQTHEQRINTGTIQSAQFNQNTDAAKEMLKQKNLTKEQEMRTEKTRHGKEVMDLLWNKAATKPEPDATGQAPNPGGKK